MIKLADKSRHPSIGLAGVLGFFGAFRFLSNFHPCRVRMRDGIEYPSSEHAYMAQKSLDMEVRRYVASLEKGADAKRFGSAMELRADWDVARVPAMAEALDSKFDPGLNQDLAQALVDTYPLKLVESNDWGDRFWGVCDGEGLNNLGSELMRVRSALMEKGLRPRGEFIRCFEGAFDSESQVPFDVYYLPSAGIFVASEGYPESAALPERLRPASGEAGDPLGTFRHRKGGVYDGFGRVLRLDSGLWHVLYRSRAKGSFWLREEGMFFDADEAGNPRFERIPPGSAKPPAP